MWFKKKKPSSRQRKLEIDQIIRDLFKEYEKEYGPKLGILPDNNPNPHVWKLQEYMKIDERIICLDDV